MSSFLHPKALATTAASLIAREVSLIQRDAPYCIQCRGLCFFGGFNENERIQWTCRPCGEVFDGSSATQQPKLTMRERVDLGPEEEAALESMREGAGRSERGHEEETVLEAMRDGDLSEEEERRVSEVDQEVTVEVGKAKPGARKGKSIQGCKPNGRPRIDVDLKKLEDLLADPDLTIHQVGERLGITSGFISYRRDHHPEFGEVWDRGLARREAARRSGTPKIRQNITKTITAEHKRYGPFCETNCVPESLGHHRDCAYWKEKHAMSNRVARNHVSVETPKSAMAQVQVAGRVTMDNEIEVRVSEIAQWPAERISEFFAALLRSIELPSNTPHVRTAITPAWSLDLESSAGDPESVLSLTTLYLMSLLHHRMEPHEKEAVWTLVQYIKRIEGYVEEKKAAKAELAK